MTTYGLTATGFVKKDFSTILEEINEEGKTQFGENLKTDSNSNFGIIANIHASIYSGIWDVLQDLYNAPYPGTSSGISLDGVCEIIGLSRLPATYSVAEVKVYGTSGTAIPTTFTISVEDNPTKQFRPISAQTVGSGTNEIQKITFSGVPVSGNWSIELDGDDTGALAYNANSATIKAAIEGLGSGYSVDVTGNYSTGIIVEFTGASGEQNQPAMSEGSINTTGETLTFTTTQAGDLPSITFDVRSISSGAVRALAGTLTVIETPILGIDSVSNAEDATEGSDEETDAEFRIRRDLSLADPGKATTDAIRSKLLEITSVTSCTIYENVEDTVDGEGRPGHSFEALIIGGDDTEIAETILENKSAGIQTYGSTTETVQNDSGQDVDISFSRPTEDDIYLELDLDTDNTAQEDVVTIDTVLNDTTYTVTINSSIATYTSDASATVAEIRDGLISSIDSLDEYVDAAADGNDVRITSTRPGQEFTTSVDSNMSVVTDVENVDAGIFPVDGEDDVLDYVLDWADDLEIGEDIIVWLLVSSFSPIPGINNVTVRIGTAPNPTLDNNISIAASHIASFDSSRITIAQT